MTIKNFVGRAVALTTAACLLTALPAVAQATEPTGTPQATATSGDGEYDEVPIDGSGEPPGDETPADAGDGKIAQRYERLPASVRAQVGEPTGAEVVVDNELRYRDYEHARFYWTPDYGVRIIFGAILDKFLALGAHETFGVPTTDELATSDGVARYTNFVSLAFGTESAIYWTPETGAHEISWQVLGHWRELGAGSALGYPTTDTTLTPDGWGLYNHFATASGALTSIYYTQPYGAHAIRGAIRARWAASGWEQGPLGYPITDETSTPDGRGRFNHFTGSGGGSIYWTPSTGAHEVYGAIRDRWEQLGWERSYLGYPTSGEFSVDWGRRNNFEGGFIDWHSATGKVYDRPW